MVTTWVLWLVGVGIAAGAGMVARDWIWRPLRLIQLCKKQGIDGFRFVPFVGQMPAIDKVLKGRNRKGLDKDQDSLTAVQDCHSTHGRTFYFTIGKTVRLSIADPHFIKDILIANTHSYIKPLHVRILGILGDGLFASSGDTWAPQRQLFNGPFHSKEVKSKVPIILECARAATERWGMEVTSGRGELDMYKKFAELTLDVIVRTAFGVEIGVPSKSASKVIGSFNRYLLNCRELVFGPPAAFPGSSRTIRKLNKEIAEDKLWLSSFMEGIIRSRKESYDGNAGTPVSYQHDLLDLMIGVVDHENANEDTPLEKHGKPERTTCAQKGKEAIKTAHARRLTKEQLLDNSLTFLLAGHETTASLLTWTIYLLAKHPLWQERARAEVEEFCPGGAIEARVLNHLKTVGMILFEALRLFPPVPLIGRTCTKENKVGSTLVIPEGLEIVIPVAVVHRDREIWGDSADEFWPARFANGISGACGNPLAFIPFGAGPRTCIGQALALTEARAVLAVMLPLFSWKLGAGYRHSPDVTLTLMPEFGMPIVLERLQ